MTEARLVGPLKGIADKALTDRCQGDKIFGADERARLFARELPPGESNRSESLHRMFDDFLLDDLEKTFVTSVPAKAKPKTRKRGRQVENQNRHAAPYTPPREKISKPDWRY